MKIRDLKFLLREAIDPSLPSNLSVEDRRFLGFLDQHYPSENRDDVRLSAIDLLAEFLADAAARGEK